MDPPVSPSSSSSLRAKLLHPLLDTRLRATKNLLFKSRSGLLPMGESDGVGEQQRLVDCVAQSLQLSTRELQQDQGRDLTPLLKRKVDTQIQQLLDLASQVCGGEAGAGTGTALNFTDLVSSLHSLVSCDKIGKVLTTHAQKVIKCVDSRQVDDHQGEFSRPYSPHSLTLRETVARDCGSFTEHKDQVEALSFNISQDVKNYSSGGGGSTGRPGCILFTDLALNGWRFPPFLFTESDEKNLFDLEVKLKMGHDSASKHVNQLLCDYPANAVLQRVGIIESILNTLSSIATNTSDGAISGLVDVEFSLKWLKLLIQNCAALFTHLFDGRLSSSIPQNASTWDNSSLAAQMSYELYAMRDPLHVDMQDGPVSSWLPAWSSCPSFSGMAFAAVAAALPLLSTQDVAINNCATELFYEALPFICDAVVGDGGVQSSQTCCNVTRLQHLLDRLEQLFYTGSNDMKRWECEEIFPHDAPDVMGEEGLNFVLDVNLHSVLAEVLSFIVEDQGMKLQGAVADSQPTPPFNTLRVGKCVEKAIKNMYSSPKLNILFPHDVLHSILVELDTSFLNSIALEIGVLSNCKRLLNLDSWADISFKGFHEILLLMLEVLQYVTKTPSNSLRVEFSILGGRANLKVVNILVAALFTALNMAVFRHNDTQSILTSNIEDQLYNLLKSLLVAGGEYYNLSNSLVSAMSIFMDLALPTTDDEREIVLIKEYYSAQVFKNSQETPDKSSLSSLLRESLSKRLSQVSFLAPFLVNAVIPSIFEVTSPSLAMGGNLTLDVLNVVLSECDVIDVLDSIAQLEGCEQAEMVYVVVHHLHILVWRISEVDTTPQLALTVESFLSRLKSLEIRENDTFEMMEITFLKVFVAGLYSKRICVRKRCFDEVMLFSPRFSYDTWPLTGLEMEQLTFDNVFVTLSLDNVAKEMSSSQTIDIAPKAVHLSLAELKSLICIAFEDRNDLTIRISAIKQMNVAMTKEPKFVLSMKKAACLDVIAKLNDSICEACDSLLQEDKYNNDDTQVFAVHCLLTLRCIVLARPILLHNFCVLHRNTGKCAEDIHAPYLLRFVVLTFMPSWKGSQLLLTFALCCHDLLRTWALSPVEFTEFKFRVNSSPIVDNLDLDPLIFPRYCATEFCSINYASVPVTIHGKYFVPPSNITSILRYVGGDEDNLPPISMRLPPSSNHDENDSTVQRCAALFEFSDGVLSALKNSKNNATFNQAVMMSLSIFNSTKCRFLEVIFASSAFLSPMVKILQVYPSTSQDFVTLNLSMRFFTAVVSQCRKSTQYVEYGPNLSSLFTSISEPLGVMLRCFMESGKEKDYTFNLPNSFESSLQGLLILLTELFGAMADFRRTIVLDIPVNIGEVSYFGPLLIGVFYCGIRRSQFSIQESSTLCLKSLTMFQHSLGRSSVIFDSLVSPADLDDSSGSLMEEVIKQLKKIRTPNSMRESTTVVNSLRCVILALKLEQNGVFARQCMERLGVACLLRYTRDRRGIIRHMALELLTVLHCSASVSLNEADCYVFGRNEHVIGERDTYIQRDHEVVDNLRVIAEDQSEALAIRCLSVRVLFACPEVSCYHCDDMIPWALSIVSELLDTSCCRPSVEATLCCVQVLRRILKVIKGRHNDIHSAISKLKIIPKIVNALQPGYVADLLQDMLCRLYNKGHRLRSTPTACYGGWKRLELKFVKNQQTHISAMHSLCFVTLNDICYIFPDVLRPCLKNTNVVRNLIFVLTDSSYTKFLNSDTFLLQKKMITNVLYAVSAAADFFSFILIRDQLNEFDDEKVNGVFGIIGDLISDPVVVCASVVSSITKILDFVAGCQAEVVIFNNLVSSLLRLLLLLLKRPSWRAGVGLSVVDGITGLNSNVYSHVGEGLYSALLSIMAMYIATSTTTMINAVYPVFSCFLQYSAMFRGRFQVVVSSVAKNYKCGNSFGKCVSNEVSTTGGIDTTASIVATHTICKVFEGCGIQRGHPTESKSNFRDRVRDFHVSKNSDFRNQPIHVLPLAELWGPMTFFIGAFKHSEIQDLFGKGGLPSAFVRLLHYSESTKETSSKVLPDEIEGLVLASIGAVIVGTSTGKHACLSSSSSRTSVRINMGVEDECNGTPSSMLLCRLLSIGLQHKKVFPNRLLALRLLESLARDCAQGSATLRNIIHNDIMTALHNDLKSNSQASAESLPAEIFSALLDALGSVILLPATDNTKSTPGTTLTARFQSIALPADSVLSISELVKWTYDRYSSCSIIVLSLTRFVGRLSCENSVLKNQQWIVTCRKTFAMVLAEEILHVVAATCGPCHCAQVRTIALMTVWFILHRSQRARSFFKRNSQGELFCDAILPKFTNPNISASKQHMDSLDLDLFHAGRKMICCIIDQEVEES